MSLFFKKFEEIALKSGSKTAIVEENGSISYSDLYTKVLKTASLIAAQNIPSQSIIPVLLPQSTDYIASMIAILASGHAFAPLSLAYPSQRIEYICQETAAPFLMDQYYIQKVQSAQPLQNIPKSKEADKALIVYTSGSTGNPKGIIHSHKSFYDCAKRFVKIADLTENDKYLATVPFSFVAVIFDIFTPLLCGAELHLLAQQQRKDIQAIENYIWENNITSVFLSPQLLKLFNYRGKNLRLVLTGSERVSQTFSKEYRTINLYGSSETTPGVLYFEIDKKYDNTPLGKPADAFNAYLLNAGESAAADGEEGEICIAGPIADGYINLPEQTEKAFSRDPFSSYGDIMFHTGDIGKKLPDGNIVYINRMDWMVKINGQRVEIGEIELQLRNMPEIDNAVVKGFENAYNQTYLCGYYTAKSPVDEKTLISRLREKLPEYMIPAFFVKLDTFPVNPNGKMDRKALLEPDISLYKKEYSPPQNEIQRQICEAFEQILNCGKIGIHDDFFALGGDSIKAIMLIEKCSIPGLSATDIFSGKTAEKIAEKALTIEFLQKKQRVIPETLYPLTESQLGIYVECTANPQSTAYNIPVYFPFAKDAQIDKEKLIRAIAAAFEKHPLLYTNIVLKDAEPHFKAVIPAPYEISTAAADEEDIPAIQKDFVKPFDLEKDRLFRIKIYETAKNYYLFADFHHIIFDGTSMEIFCRQIEKAYTGKEIYEEKITFLDMALHEKKLFAADSYKKAKKYFSDMFSSCGAATMIKESGESQHPSSGHVSVILHEDPALAHFAQKNGITENTLFLGAFAYALAKFTASDEAVFCAFSSGRKIPELSETTGMFVKTLPVCINFDEEESAENYLSAVQTRFFEVMENDICRFSEISQEFGITADIMFVYQAQSLNGIKIGDYEARAHFLDKDPVCGLSVMVFKKNGYYEIAFVYRKNLYNRELINSLGQMMMRVTEQFAQGKLLKDVTFISPQEEMLLERFNRTERAFESNTSIPELFHEQALKTPGNTAVVFKNKKLSYRQLDELSQNLAGYIKDCGLGKEDVVSILIPRSELFPVCTLGALKAGAAYQPLDPSYPQERLSFMVKDANAALLIADKTLLHLISGYEGKILLTQEIPNLPSAQCSQTMPSLHDLFILLYTSGTTGLPKGCMLEHGNLLSFCQWFRRYYSLSEKSAVTAYASFGFDANMMEMYPALISGSQIHIIDEEIRLDLIALNRYFETNGITHSFMTTQVGRQFTVSVDNKSLEHLSVGGEKLSPLTPPSGYTLHNLYGPTECTVLITAFDLDRYYNNIPIGKPPDNVKLYITDKHLRKLPLFAQGELCAAGLSVSRGYLNRPEATEKAFVPNPFSNQKGYEKIYRTGDIVRYLPDGNIEYTGRNDGQVKIRGFRIELSEAEKVIRDFPGIKDAVVAALDEPGGGKYLAAYIVSDQNINIDELNEFILKTKPSYMVPAVTMQIETIPLNQNQKVNRRALPTPVRQEREITPPVNEIQRQIFQYLAEVTGRSDFGITDDIYRSGLTSIGALKLNVLLSEKYEIAVRTQNLIANNTIAKLEAFIKNSSLSQAIEKLDSYPLTKTQSGVFTACVANPESVMYNIPLLFKLDGQIDLLALKKAIEKTAQAHPYVKTTLFIDQNGEIMQKRCDDEPFEAEILGEMNKETLIRPFNLLGERLVRTQIYETPSNGNYLFLDFHHIISDGTSLTIFLEDISAAYLGKELKQESYSGFEAALDEQKIRAGEEYSRARDYYARVFTNRETGFLPPADSCEPSCHSENCRLQTELNIHELRDFCKKLNITLNTFFTAVFGFITGKYSYKEEAIFAAIHNGRSDSRLARTCAMLVKTFPVSCYLEPQKTVKEYLSETSAGLIEGMSHEAFSFAEINNEFGVKADILFAFQGDEFNFSQIGGREARLIPLPLRDPKAPLSVDVLIENDRIVFSADYRKDTYTFQGTGGFLESFECAAKNFLHKKTLGEISILSEKAEKKLSGFNSTDAPAGQISANLLFEKQALQNPNKTAVISCGEKLTFSELNARANRIAHSLIAHGCKTGDLIALMLPRTKDLYSVRQGIIKTGAAFLPIDPSYPDERILYILSDSKAPFIIMDKSVQTKHPELVNGTTKIILLENLLETSSISNPSREISPDDPVYCIYTSGSTGRPKGVLIRHRNLVNYVVPNHFNAETNAYIENAEVSLALAALTFDVSILEECTALYNGITVCMANEEEIHNPLALSELILENKVNAMTCTPSFLMNIIDAQETQKALKQIKMFNIGAESFPSVLYDKIKHLGTKARVFNGYGPTETTIGCTFEEIKGEKITIGTPMSNMKIVMADKNMNILPPGAPGELIILGSGVGAGYIGKPELTKEKFITLMNLPAYRSGDLARWNHCGKIEFSGRMDNQVKLHGLRIELDEIENVINSFPSIKSSSVIVREYKNSQILCAYFTATYKTDIKALREYLEKTLTPYMVPTVLMQLDSLPLTNNGKIDKRALPEPICDLEEKDFVPPQTPLAKKLCDIFALILKTDKIGMNDDFFRLGGTSLSASKAAMKFLSNSIPLSYSDLFEYKTVAKLENFILSKSPVETTAKIKAVNSVMQPECDALRFNRNEFVNEIKPGAHGNIVLTGSTGFLGIHVLHELIANSDCLIYCPIRKGKSSQTENRLKGMLMYYFGKTFEELFNKRIFPLEGDVTDKKSLEKLQQYSFHSVINCAACVKHFSADDILKKINIEGVNNLIELCRTTGSRLIQISTVSIAGDNINGKFPFHKKLHEDELDFGQDISNKYVMSKFQAEKNVIRAVCDGNDYRIIRVGNLMSRQSDGEFQINYITNGFMRQLKGYASLGKCPVSVMDSPVEFSPIDRTAEAIVLLAHAQGNFTVFHAYNNHSLDMGDVIYAMNIYGIPIKTVSDDEFGESLMKAVADDSENLAVSGLVSYLSSDSTEKTVFIEADNAFTTKALYRLGYKWPITDELYLQGSIKALDTLGFFDITVK